MSKDIELQCLDCVMSIANHILNCDDCAEVYVDYSLLRYPYVSLVAILTKCSSTANEYCKDKLYDVVLELTITIDIIDKGLTNLDKDLTNLRIKCNEGWLEYGYTIPKMHSVPYVTKGFTLLYHGKKLSIESINQKFTDTLYKVLNLVITKARHIMELDGII